MIRLTTDSHSFKRYKPCFFLIRRIDVYIQGALRYFKMDSGALNF
jgi:hypothetical protein